VAPDAAAALKAAAVKADAAHAVGRSRRPDRNAGLGEHDVGWVAQGPPIKQRFLAYDDTAIDVDAAAPADSPGGAFRVSTALRPRSATHVLTHAGVLLGFEGIRRGLGGLCV